MQGDSAVTSGARQGPQKLIMYAKRIGGMHAGRWCSNVWR